MTDYGATGPNIRLSNAERDEAVARLSANQREGRLSEADFASRSAAVRSAVTRADLDPVFSDLPPAEAYPSSSQAQTSAQQPIYKASDPYAGGGTAGPAYTQSPSYPRSTSNPQSPSYPQGDDDNQNGVFQQPNQSPQAPGLFGWGGNGGWGSPGTRVAYSIAPLVALVLFFITGFLGGWTWAWLWFLIVPITGAVLYALSSGRTSSGRNSDTRNSNGR